MREAIQRALSKLPQRDVSIRASRAGGDQTEAGIGLWTKVSIRASRAGGDLLICKSCRQMVVSIRASRAGGDPTPSALLAGVWFQSAPPVREAMTAHQLLDLPDGVFQSAPPVREAMISALEEGARAMVSIRASRAGGDRLDR